MTKSPAEIVREAEETLGAVHTMTDTPRIHITDVLTQYREDAEASLASDQEETERRQRAARRDQLAHQRAVPVSDGTGPNDYVSRASLENTILEERETLCKYFAQAYEPVLRELRQEVANVSLKYEVAATRYETLTAQIRELQAHINTLSEPSSSSLPAHSSRSH